MTIGVLTAVTFLPFAGAIPMQQPREDGVGRIQPDNTIGNGGR